MNTIWHVSLPPDRTNAATVIRLIKDRFYSFATVLGTGFLLLVSLVLNAWIAAMRISVPRAATFMMSYLVIAVLFAALYKIVPDVRLKWSDVALGAMITSLLFMIGKQSWGCTSRIPASDRRIAPPARRLSCCYGYTTRRSYSFGALSSVRCTRRPWDPKATGSSVFQRASWVVLRTMVLTCRLVVCLWPSRVKFKKGGSRMRLSDKKLRGRTVIAADRQRRLAGGVAPNQATQGGR